MFVANATVVETMAKVKIAPEEALEPKIQLEFMEEPKITLESKIAPEPVTKPKIQLVKSKIAPELVVQPKIQRESVAESKIVEAMVEWMIVKAIAEVKIALKAA